MDLERSDVFKAEAIRRSVKMRADFETAWTLDSWVADERLRTFMSSTILRRRMRRETVVAFSAPTCIVAMEVCCGAHHMGRTLAAQGHTERLMSPEYVRPM
jgi:transposase